MRLIGTSWIKLSHTHDPSSTSRFILVSIPNIYLTNPNFLVPTAPPTKPVQNLKELPKIEKKVILRKNIREKNQKENVNYGWRNNYKQSNNVFVNQTTNVYINNDNRNHCSHHSYYTDNWSNWRYEDKLEILWLNKIRT